MGTVVHCHFRSSWWYKYCDDDDDEDDCGCCIAAGLVVAVVSWHCEVGPDWVNCWRGVRSDLGKFLGGESAEVDDEVVFWSWYFFFVGRMKIVFHHLAGAEGDAVLDWNAHSPIAALRILLLGAVEDGPLEKREYSLGSDCSISVCSRWMVLHFVWTMLRVVQRAWMTFVFVSEIMNECELCW